MVLGRPFLYRVLIVTQFVTKAPPKSPARLSRDAKSPQPASSRNPKNWPLKATPPRGGRGAHRRRRLQAAADLHWKESEAAVLAEGVWDLEKWVVSKGEAPIRGVGFSWETKVNQRETTVCLVRYFKR